MLKVIRESAIERPWFYRTLMFLIAAIFVVTMGWWGFEENKEDIIVRVGDDKVSRSEYLQTYQFLTERYRYLKQEGAITADIPEDQLKQQTIDQLIESRLWMQAAREMGVVVMASQPTPAVPMQDSAQTERALQAVMNQKQQRALMAYQEGLRAGTPISVRRELM